MLLILPFTGFSYLRLRQVLKDSLCPLDLFCRQLIVVEFTLEVTIVARQIHQAMAAHVEQNDLFLAEFLELFLGFQPDNGLVEQYVVQDTPQRVAGGVILITHGRFNGLTDGNAETARAIRVPGQDVTTRLGLVAGARYAGAPPRSASSTFDRAFSR